MMFSLILQAVCLRSVAKLETMECYNVTTIVLQQVEMDVMRIVK